MALVADIEKAFLQIAINEKDRDFLRFLWFDNVFSKQPKIVRNRFARVIFGVTSSPYLLNETNRKHGQKYDFDIDFVNTVFNSFYVHDFVGRENSLEGAVLLFKKLKLRFLGLFHLKKWKTNDLKLREFLSDSKSTKISKVLGILWDEHKDTFIYDFKEICELAHSLPLMKRNLLRILATYYDPLGMLQPIIIKMKIMFQQICKLSLDWDSALPDNLKQTFFCLQSFLKENEQIEVPRYIFDIDKNESQFKIKLHGFSDASLQAYGAVIYSRCLSKSSNITTNLIPSKSRAAPIKPTTAPRLELLSNLLLARLMKTLKKPFKISTTLLKHVSGQIPRLL